MRKLSLISSIVSVFAVAAIALPQVAMARPTDNTNSDACNLNPVVPTSLTSTNKNFTYNANNTVTGQFKVDGTDPNCKMDVVFASWKSPNASGYPLKDQTLFDYSLGKFSKGTHTLTVKLPECGYWQIDLLKGTKPTADDGSADYGFFKAHMLDTALGGKPCEEKPPVTPPVTPEVPKTPVTPAVSNPEYKSLPNTGAGSVIAGTMGLSTSVGLAYNLIRKRKIEL